jgi:hypothetical protein
MNKKFVVHLSVEECDQLESLVARGKAAAAHNYPQAGRLVLVCDNLNTHTGGALYEAFPVVKDRLAPLLDPSGLR